MLEYLISYDVDEQPEVLDYEPLDITDKTILQDQLNNAREAYYKLIKIYDGLQNEYLQAKSELSVATREIAVNNPVRTDRTEAMATSLKIINLKDKVEALQEAMKTVDNQLTFVKTDIRILTSSMYTK